MEWYQGHTSIIDYFPIPASLIMFYSLQLSCWLKNNYNNVACDCARCSTWEFINVAINITGPKRINFCHPSLRMRVYCTLGKPREDQLMASHHQKCHYAIRTINITLMKSQHYELLQKLFENIWERTPHDINIVN